MPMTMSDGDHGGVGGGKIRTLSSAANQEAWELRRGLDDYCTYESRAISGTGSAQGAEPHDDASAGIRTGLNAWRGLVCDLSEAIAEADDALDGGHRPLPGADDEGEQLHDVGQLGLDAPPAALDLPAEPPVAAGRAADEGDERGEDQQRHAHVAHHRDEQAGPDRGGEGGGGPQELLEPELLVGQGAARPGQTAPHRLRRRAQPLQHVPRRADGRQQHRRDRAPVGVGRTHAQQARGRGRGVDVGGEPVGQREAATAQRRGDQEQAAGRHESGEGSQVDAHRSTRFSSGRRPSRSMSR